MRTRETRGGWIGVLWVAAFSLAAPIAIHADQVPPESAPSSTTRARLDAAVVPLNERELDVAYQFHSRFVTGKPDGQVLEERIEVWEIDRNGSSRGPGSGRLLSSRVDGEDVTEARRAEVAKERREAEDDGDSEEESNSGFAGIVDLLLPGEKDGDLYVFESEPRDGETCAARFEPPAGSKLPDRAARGSLRWNCETHEPLHLSATRIDTPALVDQVFVEWDFETVGDVVFAKRYRLVVEGGVLFVKRRYEFEGTTEGFTQNVVEAIE